MARGCYGRCAAFLVAALVLDAAGLALVLAGAVGHPSLHERPFGDFLTLTGGLLLFLSLLCWLIWYSGNLRGVPAGELPLGARPSPSPSPSRPSQPRSPGSLLRLAAKLSERLSQRRRPAQPPSLPPHRSPPAKGAASTAAAAPLELSRLRPAAHPEHAETGERLV